MDDRLLQNGARHLLAVDQFVIPRRDVPGVAQENPVIASCFPPVELHVAIRLGDRGGSGDKPPLDTACGWMDNQPHGVARLGVILRSGPAWRIFGRRACAWVSQIKPLELQCSGWKANLGLRLIERTTRHLRLTDAGDTIYRRVQPLFVALHDTRSEALAMSSSMARHVSIKSPYEFGAHHAGPVACDMMSRFSRTDDPDRRRARHHQPGG